MYEKLTKPVLTEIRKGGRLFKQKKLTEEFSDMGMLDIQKFLNTRSLSVSGCSEFTDPENGESTLCLEIERFGKATCANIGHMLKGKIRWNHLILDGQRVF